MNVFINGVREKMDEKWPTYWHDSDLPKLGKGGTEEQRIKRIKIASSFIIYVARGLKKAL